MILQIAGGIWLGVIVLWGTYLIGEWWYTR